MFISSISRKLSVCKSISIILLVKWFHFCRALRENVLEVQDVKFLIYRSWKLGKPKQSKVKQTPEIVHKWENSTWALLLICCYWYWYWELSSRERYTLQLSKLTELVILYSVETSITWNEDIYRHWPVFWHMLTLLVLSNDSFHLDFNPVICLWTWEGIEKGQIEMKVKKYDLVSCHQTMLFWSTSILPVLNLVADTCSYWEIPMKWK